MKINELAVRYKIRWIAHLSSYFIIVGFSIKKNVVGGTTWELNLPEIMIPLALVYSGV
jgi:hypothetical protein